MRTALWVWLCFIGLGSIAQEQGSSLAQLKYQQVLAGEALSNGKYDIAIENYRQILVVDSKNQQVLYHLAKLYFELGYYDLAIDLVYRFQEQKSADLAFEQSMLKAQLHAFYLEYEKAFEALRPILSRKKMREDRYLAMWSLIRSLSFSFRHDQSMQAELMPHVNTAYDEYSAIFWGGSLYFSSNKNADDSSGMGWKQLRAEHEQIYRCQDSSITTVLTYDDKNVGVLGFTDENEMLVYQDEGAGDVFISRAAKDLHKWSGAKPVESANSSYFETSLSFSSNKEWMFFVSERTEGFGKGDIYFAKKIGKNEWSQPVNAGRVLNTAGDEKFVWISAEGNRVIFASDGRDGYGNYDLYISEFDGARFSIPQVLPSPINSPGEEAFISIDTLNNHIYWSSGRIKGKGGLDIYKGSADLLRNKPQENDQFVHLKGRVLSLKHDNLMGILEVWLENQLFMVSSVEENGSFVLCYPKGGTAVIRYKAQDSQKVKTVVLKPSDEGKQNFFLNYP